MSEIGALSGKLLYGFGKRVLRVVEGVFIRRRIAYIQSSCPLSDKNTPPDVETVYDDLIELAQCVIISVIRNESLL